MNRTRLCEFPLAGSWLPWHSCGRPWALFQDAGMLQGRFDPLESWWVRRASTPLVGRETGTTPAIWGCSSCSLGVFLRGLPLTHALLATQLETHGGGALHIPQDIVPEQLSPLPAPPHSCWLRLGPWHWLHLEPACCLDATPAITWGSPKPHLTYRVLDTTALSALFQRRINPDPVTPLWWVQRAVFSPRQLPFSFLHFMALHSSNSVIMFIFPYKR